MKNNKNITPPLFLAPMAGVTDEAFRQICKTWGADVTVSEMVSAKGLYYQDKKTAALLSFEDKVRPFGVQLFGSEPEIFAYAAATVTEQYRPDFIDINMGCPMPKIVGNGDGSALMKNPENVYRLVCAVVKATNLPVSVKIRKGFDEAHITAVETAKAIEDAGAKWIAVHGRTREQMYTGAADRETIRKVKQAVHLPVIGNGDIFTPESAKDMLETTGCDGLMLARGTLGNPFLFAQVKAYLKTGTYREIPQVQKLDTALEHLKRLCAIKGERIAIPEARKHMAWYLKGMKNAARIKNAVFQATTYLEIEALIQNYKKNERPEGLSS